MSVRYWLLGVFTLGDFVLLRSYLSQLTDEVRAMGWNVRRIYEAMADANEMTEILLTPHEIKDAENAAILTVPKGMVEFRHVQFSYLVGSNLDHRSLNTDTFDPIYVLMGHALPEEAQSRPFSEQEMLKLESIRKSRTEEKRRTLRATFLLLGDYPRVIDLPSAFLLPDGNAAFRIKN